jgi:CheY-like chemotaxis protein
MLETEPNILLLEDTRTVQNYIRDVLRSLPFKHQILAARKIEEAQNLAAQHNVDLFIVDIGLPDGDGIDFLCEMAVAHSAARALIITATPRDDYRDRARQLGVLNFLPKPLQRKPLLDAVSRLLVPSEHSEGVEDCGGFEGTLGGLAPADIIQLKCLSRASGVIEFCHETCVGLVWFELGEIVQAESTTNEETIFGVPAFRAIVGWSSGTVREVDRQAPEVPTISGNWQSLLLDASQSRDDAMAAW